MDKQLCFIEPTLEEKMQVLEGKYEKLRKSVHTRIADAVKKTIEQEQEIRLLKSLLCQYGLVIEKEGQRYFYEMKKHISDTKKGDA